MLQAELQIKIGCMEHIRKFSHYWKKDLKLKCRSMPLVAKSPQFGCEWGDCKLVASYCVIGNPPEEEGC